MWISKGVSPPFTVSGLDSETECSVTPHGPQNSGCNASDERVWLKACHLQPHVSVEKKIGSSLVNDVLLTSSRPARPPYNVQRISLSRHRLMCCTHLLVLRLAPRAEVWQMCHLSMLYRCCAVETPMCQIYHHHIVFGRQDRWVSSWPRA